MNGSLKEVFTFSGLNPRLSIASPLPLPLDHYYFPEKNLFKKQPRRFTGGVADRADVVSEHAGVASFVAAGRIDQFPFLAFVERHSTHGADLESRRWVRSRQVWVRRDRSRRWSCRWFDGTAASSSRCKVRGHQSPDSAQIWKNEIWIDFKFLSHFNFNRF